MLELGKITICGKTQINGETKQKEIVVIKEILHSELSKAKKCGNVSDKDNKKIERIPFLKHLDFISAVSGGSITASYYMTHSDRNFQARFRKILKKEKLGFSKMTAELFLRMKTKGSVPLSPLLLLSSAVDTVKDLVSLPFFWLPDGFPLANPNLTPGLFLAGARGLIQPEELADVYEDWFNGKGKQFKHAQKIRPNTELLINATDVKNHRAFTFDERTFECLDVPPEQYKKFPVALAAASSSALPILFTPLELEKHIANLVRPGTRPSDCSEHLPIYHIREKFPELLDGGISENLGIGGLIKRIFYLKNQQKKGFNHSTKTFFLTANSAALNQSSLPSIGDQTTISQNVDQSLETLMRDKTDLARTIFTGPLNNFGFSMVHLNFAGIEENTPFVRKILELKLNGSNIMEDISKALEMEKTIVNDLQTIGMTATPDQIDTLIAAGQAIVQYRFERIVNDLKMLSQKKWPGKQEKLHVEGGRNGHCEDIVNPSKYYCWHENFQNKGLLERPMQTILKTFSLTTDDFLRKTTINRLKGFEKLREDLLENRQNWERINGGLNIFTKDQLDTVQNLVFSDQLYQKWLGNQDTLALEKFSDEIDEIKLNPGKLFNREKLSDEINEHMKSWENIPVGTERERRLSYAFLVATIENIKNGTPIFDNCSPSHMGIRFGVCDRPLYILKKYVYSDGPQKYPFLKKVPWSYWYAARLHNVLEENNLSFHYLYHGIKEHPFDMNLHALLGTYSILLEKNFTGGLGHLSQAKNLADMKGHKVKTLAPFNNQTQRSRLPSRFKQASTMYKMMYAFYSGIEPIEVQNTATLVKSKGYQFAKELYEYLQTISTEHIKGYGKDGYGTKEPLDEEDQKELEKVVRGSPKAAIFHLYNYALHKIRAYSHERCPEGGENVGESKQRINAINDAIDYLELAKHQVSRKIVPFPPGFEKKSYSLDELLSYLYEMLTIFEKNQYDIHRFYFSPANVLKLKKGKDPLSKFLKENFSPETQDLLDKHKELKLPAKELIHALDMEVVEINKRNSIYTTQRFQEVEMSDDFRFHIDKKTNSDLLKIAYQESRNFKPIELGTHLNLLDLQMIYRTLEYADSLQCLPKPPSFSFGERVSAF